MNRYPGSKKMKLKLGSFIVLALMAGDRRL